MTLSVDDHDMAAHLTRSDMGVKRLTMAASVRRTVVMDILQTMKVDSVTVSCIWVNMVVPAII